MSFSNIGCFPIPFLSRQKIEQHVHEFIEIVNKGSRFSIDGSPCPQQVARSYMEDSRHDLSRAIYHYLRANYDSCEAIIDEMQLMFLPFSSASSIKDTSYQYSQYYRSLGYVFPTSAFHFSRSPKHSLFESVHEHLWDDKEFVMQAVFGRGSRPHNIRFASKRLRNNHDFIMAAVRKDWKALQFASERLRNHRDIVFEAVKANKSFALEYASKRLKNHHDIVMEAVTTNGDVLVHASKRLRNNHEIVKEAVKTCGLFALSCASDALKNNRDIIMKAVKNNGAALQYASDSLKNDRDIVMEAVKKNGNALRFAHTRLKNDRDIVIKAVQNHGLALRSASDDLKNDRDIVIEAVKTNYYVVRYVSDRCRDDLEVHLEIVKNHGLCWYLYAALDGNLELYCRFCNGVPCFDPTKKEPYNRKKELIIEAVKRIKDCSIIFRQDEKIPNEDIAMEIMRINPATFRFLDDRLVIEKRFIMEYLKLSTDIAAILDAEDGMTALHCIFKSKALHSIVKDTTTPGIFTKDFGDVISAYLQHPRGKEAACMKDGNDMTPFDYLCHHKHLDGRNPLADQSFSVLMVWWYKQIGIFMD